MGLDAEIEHSQFCGPNWFQATTDQKLFDLVAFGQLSKRVDILVG